jgi:hypothetical protein
MLQSFTAGTGTQGSQHQHRRLCSSEADRQRDCTPPIGEGVARVHVQQREDIPAQLCKGESILEGVLDQHGLKLNGIVYGGIELGDLTGTSIGDGDRDRDVRLRV